MKRVVGRDMSAFSLAWVAAVIRSSQQSRPLRKQSTTLNAKTLQFPEEFLNDPSRSLVDRYAAGAFLSTIYSRACFRDLRRSSIFLVDATSDNGEGSKYPFGLSRDACNWEQDRGGPAPHRPNQAFRPLSLGE